jgi:streptogramin lyase
LEKKCNLMGKNAIWKNSQMHMWYDKGICNDKRVREDPSIFYWISWKLQNCKISNP